MESSTMSQFANANAKTSCALLHFHPEEEAAWHSAFLYIGLNGKLHSAVFVDCCVYFTTLISHIFADNFTIANKEQFKIQPFLIPSTPPGIDNAADNAKEQSPMQNGENSNRPDSTARLNALGSIDNSKGLKQFARRQCTYLPL